MRFWIQNWRSDLVYLATILLLMLLALLLAGCEQPEAREPCNELVKEFQGVQENQNTVVVIWESVHRCAENFYWRAELKSEWVFYAGTLQTNYTQLGSPAGDIAIVGSITTDQDALFAFDLRDRAENPEAVVFPAVWPRGLRARALNVYLFDDMKQPTNFRFTLVLYGERVDGSN